MKDIIHEDCFGHDNDASASSFGWNFQSNAAIFLAMHYIKDLESVKVESRLQDIDINLKNNKKILAQAKSTTDYTKYGKDKQRVYDALLSLAIAQAKHKDGTFIYITNIPELFKMENGVLNNMIVGYPSLQSGMQEQINSFYISMIKIINTKIKKCKDNDKKRKYKYELNCIKSFDKSKLALCVIKAYSGDDDNRYSSILDAIDEFLINKLNLDGTNVKRIRKDLLEFFQNKFNHNSTVFDDGTNERRLARKNILWPVIAFITRYNYESVTEETKELCGFKIDRSFLNDFEEAKEKINFIRFQQFEFSTKVIFEYKNYKDSTNYSNDLEKMFVANKYQDFVCDFLPYNFNGQMTEFITKWFLLLVLSENKCIYSTITFLGDDFNAG